MGGVPQKADSVYDFLYVDLDRIGLLLSQSGNDGVLTGLTREASTGSERGGRLDLAVVKAGGKENQRDTLSRTFNPQWLVPLTFLDQFQARFKKYLSSAALGDIVQVEGDLTLIETSGLQRLYAKETLRAIAMNKAIENAQAAGEEFNYDNAELELDMVTSAPPQVQFNLSTYAGELWSTLRPDGLITPADELAAKHGVLIQGRWHVVGILDAQPAKDPEAAAEKLKLIEQTLATRLHVADAFHISERMRAMFGRPADAFGITPLMIFRPVG